MTDEQIKHMVNRFLMWRLPEHFRPDCGIHFDADAAIKLNPRNSRYEPVGTNLFTADQATEMVRFMVDTLTTDLSAAREEIERLRGALVDIEPKLEALVKIGSSAIEYAGPNRLTLKSGRVVTGEVVDLLTEVLSVFEDVRTAILGPVRQALSTAPGGEH